MNLYIETSAVLAWLFGEATQGKIVPVLSDTGVNVSSDLTLVECNRALRRAHALGVVSDAVAAGLRQRLGTLI